MPALPAGQSVFPAPSSGMDSHRLPDYQPIFDQFSYLLTGVCIGDFIGLIGVQPDLLFATAEDTGGKPLLKPEHTHGCGRSAERKELPLAGLLPLSARGRAHPLFRLSPYSPPVLSSSDTLNSILSSVKTETAESSFGSRF